MGAGVQDKAGVAPPALYSVDLCRLKRILWGGRSGSGKGKGRGEDFSACFWRAVYLLMCRCTVISHSLGLSAVTINCTTLLFLFSLGVKGMGRIKSFSLTQSIPLSEVRVLRLSRCTWTCAPDYWLVRHPMLSWFGGLGVYLCPPGVTETKSCKLHQPFVKGLL